MGKVEFQKGGNTHATVAYLRCSTDQQDTLRQREAIERSGVEIHQWLEDHESRDRADKRRDFQRLLRAVQAGQVDTIVVQSLDRFGVKDAYEMGKFFSILRDHDCRLLDASGKHLNADDDATVLTSTIGALTSSSEQREKASRVLTGNLTLARKGNFLGGYCPLRHGRCCVRRPRTTRCGAWSTRATTAAGKVYPDGREERFDGKNNRPPKALHETLKYRPSIIAERIKYVVLIFQWFITESHHRRQNRLPPERSWRLAGVRAAVAPGRGQVPFGKPDLRRPPDVQQGQQLGRFMEFCGGQVKAADAQDRAETARIRPDTAGPRRVRADGRSRRFSTKAQAKLAAAKTRAYQAPRTAPLWLKGIRVLCEVRKAHAGLQRNRGQRPQDPGYLCAEYGRWGKRSPSGCGHYPRGPRPSGVPDTGLSDSDRSADQGVAGRHDGHRLGGRPSAAGRHPNCPERLPRRLVRHARSGRGARGGNGRAPRRATFPPFTVVSSSSARPRLEKQIAEKEAELEALLDGYKDLSPKLRERANKRGEALQDELDELKGQLRDLRIPWDQFRQELAARQEALARATKTLNQEGRHRQKAEVLRAVVDKIICHFTGTGRRVKLESIEVIPAEDAAVRPLTFPGSLLTDSCLGAFAWNPHIQRPSLDCRWCCFNAILGPPPRKTGRARAEPVEIETNHCRLG